MGFFTPRTTERARRGGTRSAAARARPSFLALRSAYRLAIAAGVALVAICLRTGGRDLDVRVVVDEVISDDLAPSLDAAVVRRPDHRRRGDLLRRGLRLDVGRRRFSSTCGDFFSHLQELSFDTLGPAPAGRSARTLGGDIQAIESFVLGGLGEAISAIARITFFAGARFLLDWQLALYALVLAPPFYLAARFFARLARQAARAKRRRSGALSAVAEESIANTALVQSLNAAGHERRRLLREGEGVVDAELVSARIAGAFSGLVALVEVAGLLALIAFGTWAVQDDRLTIGGLLAFLAYLTRFYGPWATSASWRPRCSPRRRR